MVIRIRKYFLLVVLTALTASPAGASLIVQLPVESDHEIEENTQPNEIYIISDEIPEPPAPVLQQDEITLEQLADDGFPKATAQETLEPDEQAGYESEAARSMTAPNAHPSSSLSSQQEIPLSRKAERQLRKAERNKPLDIPELSTNPFTVSAGKRTMDASEILDTPVVEMPEVIAEIEEALTEIIEPSMTARQRRQMEKMKNKADSTLYQHSPYFKDTLSMGNFAAISLVAPGFGQFYNGDYWKIPVMYATTGASLFFGIKQHQQYRKYKNEYEFLLSRPDFSSDRTLIDPVHTKVIQHNTWRQLFFGMAIGSYMYMIGDALINYPSSEYNNVRTATTLSAICPGAGQFYNGSFWKAPLLIGGFASFIYVIDWNNRGYQRYNRAVKLEMDGNPETHSEFWNQNTNSLSISVDQMKSYKQLYRRNRDLSIILTAAFYLINVMDAHVDAHMKTFDLSDDLTWNLRLQPTMEPIYMTQSGGGGYAFGLGLSLTF